MARELVLPGEDDDLEEESTTRLTTATDVWAFAMTILEVRVITFNVLPPPF